MGKATDNTKADPKDLENARQMWGNFMVLTRWSTIAVAIILVLMLIFLY